ncbi:hypothetical protein [Rosenbergiella collisarenosi]|uniref:hypothetical protein n=1 Tax=Rosenbergiella collisarenosi TaxID=1544695 RepID=UPI001F4D8B80|nr:hypothetical protein [Rosenbergiella collisarenosi]
MAKYRKKPVVIDAIQWTGKNLDECKLFTGDNFYGHVPDLREIIVKTSNGPYVVSANDYIIKGIQGEFYPCKPDIFAATYEAVTPSKPEEYAYKCSVCSRIIMSKKPQMVGELYCHRKPMIQKA